MTFRTGVKFSKWSDLIESGLKLVGLLCWLSSRRENFVGLQVTIKPENTGRNEPESTGNTKPESTGFNNKEKLNMKRKKKDDTEMLDDIRSKPDTSGRNEKLHDIDGIQCYYTNADSVMNKRHELEINIEIYQPQITGIVESSYNSSILDSEIALDGYHLFR